MRHRDVIPVHRIVKVASSVVCSHQMRHNLVPVQAVVDPRFRIAALLEPEQAAVDFCVCALAVIARAHAMPWSKRTSPRLGEIVHGNGQMEWLHACFLHLYVAFEFGGQSPAMSSAAPT